MSGTDWDSFDGDDADDYPGAPVPQHERAWRHPSELSPDVSPIGMPTPRPFGRATLVGTGVIGLALLAGLTQLVLPRSGSSGVATEATHAIGSTTVRRATTAPITGRLLQTTTAAPRPNTAPSTAAATAVSTVLASAPANSVSTVVLLSGSKQSAVPIGDGRRALTTAAGLTKDDSLEVQLGDGTSIHAIVVKVDEGANVAVLELDEAADGSVPQLKVEEPHHGDVVYVGCVSPDDGVLVSTDSGMVVEMSNTAAEGAPILDEHGSLVGLASTDEAGTVRLIPISQAIIVAYSDNDTTKLPVWLGVAFTGDGLEVDTVQPESPAESAGVQAGDFILSIGNVDVADVDQLWQVLTTFEPGATTTLLIDRAGEPIELSVTLAARPS